MAEDAIQAGQLNLLIGPVGAGKSTFGRRRALEDKGIFIDLDTHMIRLFGDDPRPEDGVMAWYLERRARCRAVLWDLALAIVGAGVDVWLESGLVTAGERRDAYLAASASGVIWRAWLLDAPYEVRRTRVMTRNTCTDPYVQVVPMTFFEIASTAWEPPTPLEMKTWRIVEGST